MTIKHIFVIGAGTMGNGISQTAAVSGFEVTCMDVIPSALESAKANISRSVEKLLSKGMISESQRDAALKIKYVGDMETISSSDLVIEAATENPDIKLNIFREMDENARAGSDSCQQYILHQHNQNCRSHQST